MTNSDFQAYPSEIELLAIECDRDSITRLSLGHYFQNGLSLLVYCYTPRELEPERVLLPGLYLLDDEIEYFTRVNIEHDSESFAIKCQMRFPASEGLILHRFAELRLGEDGDLIDFDLWTSPKDPKPIVLSRDYAHVLSNCTG